MSKFFTRPLTRTAMALFCCLLWGSAFPALKILYGECQLLPGDTGGLLLLAGGRFLTASLLVLLLGIVMPHRRAKHSGTSAMSLGLRLLLIGLVQTTAQYYFFYSGVSRIPGSTASVVNSSRVFFTLILAHLFFSDDRINLKKGLGILLGVGGILLVNQGSSRADLFSPGVLFLLGANFSGAAGGILVKKTSHRIAPHLLTGFQLLIGSLVLLILSWLIKPSTSFVFTVKGGILFFYTALLSAAAFVLWSYLLKYNRAGEIGFYLFAIPLLGTLLSVIFLSEPFTINLIFSLLLVCGGIVLVNLNSSSKKPKIKG